MSIPLTAETSGSDAIGFGSAEIAYLLSRYEPAAVARAAALLQIDLTRAGQPVFASGASSLLARGFAHVEGDEVVLDGAAAVLAYAFVAGTHWTEIGLMASREETADGAVMIQAPQAVAMLQPRALGTWFLLLKDPQVSSVQAVRILAEAFLATHAGGAVFLGARTPSWDATLFLRRGETTAWELARGASPFWGEATKLAADDAGLDASLEALLRAA
jgi:hypothetical protein